MVSAQKVLSQAPSRHCLWRSLLCLIGLVFLCACEQGGSNTPTPKAGVLDLSSWKFATEGPVPLTGEWRFYPGVLLDKVPQRQQGTSVNVPHVWNDTIENEQGFGFGAGTYVLDIKVAPGEQALGISVKTISSAFELLVDGQPVAEAGQVGLESSTPGYRPQVARLPASDNELQLLIRVTNFQHARGGLWDVIWLGHYEEIHDNFYLRLNLAMLLACAAILIGLYHLLIWSLRPSDLPTLAFAALCFGLGTRTLCINEIFLLQVLPGIGYSNLLRIEYFSLVATVLFSLVFVWRMFKQEFSTRYMVPLIAPIVAYLIVIVYEDIAVFTGYLPYFHALAVVYLAVVSYGVFKAIANRRSGAWLYGLSISFFALFVLQDLVTTIFKNLPRLEVLGGDEYLLPIGFTAVLLAQAMLIAMRAAQAKQNLEQRTQELSLAHDKLDRHTRELEQRVAERTAELEEANVLLDQQARVDGLTQLANRRQFDERLQENWSDHQRRGKPLSLILIDVDHFKGFNDHYGHVIGDEALKAVAKALKAASKRPSDLIARYGGDEMVVLLPNTDYEGARQLAEQMRSDVMNLSIPHLQSDLDRLSISLGVATQIPSSDHKPSELLESADRALYRAKADGRDRVA